jgi:ABC-type polysaccharide/polyol phosphate export permease
MNSKSIKDLISGLSLWHVWLYQAYHDISAKYKRTALGSLWIAGSMVVTSLSFGIAFGALFGANLADTLPHIMGGFLCYNLIAYVLQEAPETYLSNSGIISNHAYPFTYYSFEMVAKNVLFFLHNLVVFLIVLVVLQKFSVPHWSIIIGLPVVLLNMLTWGTLAGLISARYRDLRFLLPYFSQMVIVLTPIMYKPEILKKNQLIIVDLNPFYPFVEMVRAPLLGQAMPVHFWNMAMIVSGLGVALWLIFFNLFRKRIAFWV